MTEERGFRFTTSVLLVPMALALAIWTVYLLELRLGVNFNSLGIYPRKLSGLKGILLSPWIHGSLSHLYNNTLPLVILSAALFYFYRTIAWKTLVWGLLLTGLLTWGIGRASYHIGASGLIYLMASFIFFKGIISRHYRLTALSLFVVFIYGGMLWYLFPVRDGISWEGHLSGAVSGLLLAMLLKAPLPERKRYSWEQQHYNEAEDPFMKHFDAEGNFVEAPDEAESEPASGIRLRYEYKPKKDPEGDRN